MKKKKFFLINNFLLITNDRLVRLADCLLHLNLSSNGLVQLNPQVGQLKELRFLDLRYFNDNRSLFYT